MPLKAQQSIQLITHAQAIEMIQRLTAKGVPVENVREIGPSGEVSINHPEYFDDGAPHQFIARVWGVDVELGIVKVQLESNPGLTGFLNVALGAFASVDPAKAYARAYDAVLRLPGVTEAVNAVLS
jgi:hypothetical protein